MAKRQRKQRTFVVVRDSADLGLDRGMRVHAMTMNHKTGKMHIYVPAMDATIASVAIGHPDLKPV